MDSAAIAFTRAFYLTLLSGDTVQHSFDIAKQALRASPYVPDSVLEGEKFVLLPECSTEACGEGSKMVPPGYHNVSIFDGKQLKQWPAVASQCSMSNRNLPTIAINTNMLTSSILTQPLPSAPPDFEGREVDMHKVIVTLFARRLVSVLGEDGVGKSALAAAVCNYLSDRCIFEDGIFYVPCKSVVSHEGFLAQLQKVLLHSSAKMHTRVKAFASTMSFFQPINASNGPIRHMPQGIDSDEMFLLEELIITSFGNLKCLLVLDCTNQLLRDNDAATDMKMFISRMFSKCKYVKVLMTSNDNLIGLQQLGGLIEYPVRLGPLSLRNSLRLFAKLTPVLPSAELKIEFVDSILHGRKAVTTKAPKASTGSISTTETGTGTGTSTGATAGSNGESVSVVITPLSGSGNTPSDSASKPISVTRSNNSGTVSDVGGGAGTTPPVVSAARRQVEATTATKVLALFGDGHPGIIVKMASEYDAAAIYRLRDECWRITADDNV